jgi:hypothetical protein
MPYHRKPVRTSSRHRCVENKRAFRPLFEQLEDRRLLTVTLANGVLNINGAAGADTIAIAPDPNDASKIQVTLNGQASSFALSAITSIVVAGQAGNDALTLALAPTMPVTFNGGAGADTLIAPNVANTWTITAAGTGSLNSGGSPVAFTGIENLTGGTDTDTVSYAAIPRAVTVNLQTNKVTVPSNGTVLTAVFTNIDSFVGSGTAADTLIGRDQSNTWAISGANAGTVSGVAFSGFENLTGGAQADVFQFGSAGSISGKLDGGNGVNTLNYSSASGQQTFNLQNHTATLTGGFARIQTLVGATTAANTTVVGPNTAMTWDITSDNAGDVSGLTFSSVGNLVGGTLADLFVFSNGASVSGTINGGNGSDTLKYTAYLTPVLVNLETGETTGADGGFSNVEKFNGSAATTNIPATDTTPASSVIDPDTLIASNTVNTWNISGINAGIIHAATRGDFAFSSFENLTGGTLADRFVIADQVGVTAGTIDGGGGNNTLDYSAYSTAVVVDLTGAGSATSAVTGGTLSSKVSNIHAVFGGKGADTLTGSSGRDFLFGGKGADTLTGGGDDDILFSGTTTFGANATLIDSLLTYWNGADNFTTRVSKLRAGTSGVPKLPKFNGNNIKNDASVDHLDGGTGNDWIFGKLTAPNIDLFPNLDSVNDIVN